MFIVSFFQLEHMDKWNIVWTIQKAFDKHDIVFSKLLDWNDIF